MNLHLANFKLKLHQAIRLLHKNWLILVVSFISTINPSRKYFSPGLVLSISFIFSVFGIGWLGAKIYLLKDSLNKNQAKWKNLRFYWWQSFKTFWIFFLISGIFTLLVYFVFVTGYHTYVIETIESREPPTYDQYYDQFHIYSKEKFGVAIYFWYLEIIFKFFATFVEIFIPLVVMASLTFGQGFKGLYIYLKENPKLYIEVLSLLIIEFVFFSLLNYFLKMAGIDYLFSFPINKIYLFFRIYFHLLVVCFVVVSLKSKKLEENLQTKIGSNTAKKDIREDLLTGFF